MMRNLFTAAIALAFITCKGDEPIGPPTDTRMPVAVEYVRGATLKIHAKPADDATVVSTYQRGESVSILSRKGEWAEVRTASGSGWARVADMADAGEAKKALEENVYPHFINTPAPISQPGAHGELIFEAQVDRDGIVTSVRTLSNTTGSMSLEQRNAASLQAAAFTPVVRKGKRESFVYEHRVHY
ncbi:MAG: hypothetical protein QOC81_1470 [Thermoanaerobaculia bacterium]|jgi:hypothetical protein|nr:hypothetical protein [Thermoanaerobaculia bacterium]